MTDGNLLLKGLLKATKGSMWKESSQRGLLHALKMIFDISDELYNRTYKCDKLSTFTIHERGRLRVIDSYNVRDRTIRHVLCDDIYDDLIRPKLIYDNGASLKGRGISHSRKRFETHLRKYYMNHHNNKGYILFGDFSKYYDNILQVVAKDQLLSLVDYDEYMDWLLTTIFKTFEINVDGLDSDAIDDLYNGIINKLSFNPIKTESCKTIKKSISIGDQLSQHIGIYYPHSIDDYIKIVKSQKYYGRYMDDFYIMSNSREELLDLLDSIISIGLDFGLHVNRQKTYMVRMDSVYKYLQIKYQLTSSGKIIKRINPKRVTSLRIRLKKLKSKVDYGIVDYDNVENMFKSWMGSYNKLLSNKQRSNLISLYESLYNCHIEVYKNKMYIIREEILNV